MPPRTVVRRTVRQEPQEEERPTPTDDDEVERPTGRRTAARRAAPTSSAKEYDPEEDEAERAAAREERDTRRNQIVRHGWSGYRTVRAEAGDFPENFSITKEPQLFLFLEDEPFADYLQHWIERDGKKSWTCIGKKNGCALCDVGDNPQTKVCLNIAVLEGEEWTNKVWTVGSRVAEVLQNFANDDKTGPLATRDPILYWSVTKTGKGGKSQTNVTPVKARDLAEDWGIDPLSDDDIEALAKGCYTKDSVPVNTAKQLKEIAEEISDED